MPKGPITFRESFYMQLRPLIQNPPLYRPLEWNHVETELGTMVEPRVNVGSSDASGKIVNADITDVGVNKVSIIDDGDFQSQYGTGGGSLVDFGA